MIMMDMDMYTRSDLWTYEDHRTMTRINGTGKRNQALARSLGLGL